MSKTSIDLVEELRAKLGKYSQKQLAARLQITPQYLNDILNERREISERIAEIMGYQRRVIFERSK